MSYYSPQRTFAVDYPVTSGVSTILGRRYSYVPARSVTPEPRTILTSTGATLLGTKVSSLESFHRILNHRSVACSPSAPGFDMLP